jgi:isopentenyl diphosphate isomerase/L-lactate dehydrogenase-like FMN-dependent dehydrogenase
MAPKPVSIRPIAGVAFLVADRRATRWRFIELGRLPMSSEYDPAANRRRFLQYLAASPLLAAGGAQALAETILPKTMGPDPLMWGPRQADHLIKTPKEAINVFDLEPVCRQNVPPAHFGYMASGVDDEMTLRANREGFLKFQLRPRRLVDVSKVDMSVDILGTKYSSPIVCAPVGGQRSFHDDAESGVARAAKAGGHLQILSTMTSDTVEDVIKARGAPIWMQLYATNKWEVAAAITKRAENAGCTALAVTVDRNGGRNQETLARLRPSDTRDCSGCHDRSSLQSSLKTRAMWKDLDLTGLRNTQSSAMTWDFFKRMRDHTKMKLLAKGILAWEDAAMAADAGLDGIIVSNHGARSEDSGRATIDALPEIVEAVKGRIPILVDSGFRRGSDVVKALCIGATAVCVGRPYIWGLGAFGQAGVERALELLRVETSAMMQQVGAPNVKALVPAMVRRA